MASLYMTNIYKSFRASFIIMSLYNGTCTFPYALSQAATFYVCLAATLGPLAHFSCSARPPNWTLGKFATWEVSLGKIILEKHILRVSDHFKYYNHIRRVLDLIF